MGLRKKIVVLGAAATALPLLVIAFVFGLQIQKVDDIVDSSAKSDAVAILNTELSSLLRQAELTNTLLKRRVEDSMRTAEDILSKTGKIVTSPERRVSWVAVNQGTKDAVSIELPKLLIGDRWFGKIEDFNPNDPVPIVDDLMSATGDTATVFQRMNLDGDMLRVATNVKKADGSRAIGTYIPSSSPVVQTVLKGETFRGRAFVVNQYYITVYKPLCDERGEVIGVLYVGTPEEIVLSTLRDQIEKTKIKNSGHVFVVHGSGDSKGSYVVSGDRSARGRSVLENSNSETRTVFQSMIEEATQLHGEEHRSVRFLSQSVNSDGLDYSIASFGYFEPWDWVIAASAPESEVYASKNAVSETLRYANYLGFSILAVSILASVVLFFAFATRIVNNVSSIARRLVEGARESRIATNSVSDASALLANGSSEQASSLEETSASLKDISGITRHNADSARSANGLTAEARSQVDASSHEMQEMISAMREIGQSSSEISTIIKTIDEIAFQTNVLSLNAAVEAARAGDAGAGFAVVADEVRALALRSSQAAAKTSRSIEDAIKNSTQGSVICQRVEGSLNRIVEIVHQLDSIVAEIAKSCDEQNEGVSQIDRALDQMNSVTQDNAACAERTAVASDQQKAQSLQMRKLIAELVEVVAGKPPENSDSDSGGVESARDSFGLKARGIGPKRVSSEQALLATRL
ncbi:Methyl-accepting chemotaxis protein signaling domain [Verrucomicrobiia bacterium DG1235]|nr:Methyl-accepting chemotaxis protein signaling domain [Verrucomicrobiae bacterium DG1235]